MENQIDLEDVDGFPREDDKLFPDDMSPTHHSHLASLMNKPLGPFYTYSEGYKDGAQHLINFCLKTRHGLDFLIYPIAFLYRHYIELRLKELIINLNYCTNETREFPRHHDISTIWDDFQRLAIEFAIDKEQNKNDFANTGRIIKEFSSIDPGSFAFRYPVDKKGNDTLNSQTLPFVSIKHFGKVMAKVANFLDAYRDYLEQYVDIANDMYNEFYSELYSDHM